MQLCNELLASSSAQLLTFLNTLLTGNLVKYLLTFQHISSYNKSKSRTLD